MRISTTALAGRVRMRLDAGLVDEAQVDDVDRDFRIEAGAQLAPHHLLDGIVVGIDGKFQRLGRFLADGVGVETGDAEQVAFDEHRPAAAERLGDVTDAACRQRDLFALGHEDGGAIALETDGFAASGIHVR
jgi:hypothetical protein